ncbi:MAG: alpha/beta fold hydrolase [Candidatus Beckwithbacteria bacterium]
MNKIKKFWWLGVVLAAGLILWYRNNQSKLVSPEAPTAEIARPLNQYRFEELRQQVSIPSQIEVKGEVFFFETGGKRMSGQIKIPTGNPPTGGWPVVIMLRGYVDQEIYETGVGTKNAAAYFSQNGYLTLAPDFLGFGQSDQPPNNTLEERFMRPVQILDLIASVKTLSFADPERIHIWGHSNGGQIALSVLEISGQDYPAVLWAPVSKPFPYSILYYTDESDDRGKALRRVLASFDALYEADEFSIEHYLNFIQARIQIHQGTSDESVPLKWSQDLYKRLKELDKEVELYVYPGADHNLVGSWDEAAKRSLMLFRAD